MSRLRKDVSETNDLLKSIGAGVNLNMSDVVEKQVREMLTRFKSEIQKMASQSAKSGQQAADGLKPAVSQIQTLLTTTQRLAADGTLAETRKGYDALGRSITEVYKNGQQLNKTLKADSALTAEIQNANRLYREQSDALKQIYRLKTQRLKVQDDTPYAQSLDGQIANLQTLIDGNRKLIAQMDQQAVARSRLVELAREEAQLSSRYGNAQQSRAQSAGTAELHQMQQAYRQLTTAYRQYNIAVKNGNETGKEYWSQSAAQAMEEIQQIEQKLVSLNIEESVRKQILDLIQQAKNAEAAHQEQLEGTGNQLSRLDQSLDRMGSRLLQMASTMLVLRG